MTHPCEMFRQEMVLYLRGEMPALEKARLEGHLGHCRACAKLRRELGEGLSAAQTYEPTLAPEHLRRLIARLSPYTEAGQNGSKTRILAWGGVALVAASVLLTVGVLVLHERVPSLKSAPPLAIVPVPVAPQLIAITHLEPAPHVRLIADAAWNGEAVVKDRRVSVRLSRGFVAASFNGGRGRSLRVTTPHAVIDAVGTRFLVEVDEHDGSTVVVADGWVRVESGDQVAILGKGEVQSFAADGGRHAPPLIRGAAFLEELFLVEHHGSVAAPVPARKPDKEGITWPVLDQLEQAEALVNKGQYEAAMTIYQSCVGDAAEAYAPFRQLCRLEMARLLGFKLGKLERARDVLQRLVRENSSEVGRQASLALCELDLRNNPCRAIACLEDLVAAKRSEPELKREAERLRDRWRETASACERGGKR